MNPTGLVPTIDDDGFVLWESHSIVRYLAAKHATGRLSPADLRQRADAERWMDWTYTFQKEFQRPIFWPLVRTPPEKRDPGAIEAARKICADLLKIPEQYLAAGRRYLAGNELTIADIPLGCHVQLWMRLPLERPEQPHLRAWFERLCERPAYRKIVDIPLS
jgi:glutathione S-transferase